MDATKVSEYRRHAIILFADLCDFTALNEVSDPEDVALLLRRVRDKVDKIVVAHGGAVNEWRGDGVLCTFGLPRASEDDARNAITAALAMHDAVRGLESELPVPLGFQVRLHSGIHGGVVFASEREASQGYDLVGDTVNTAARLCERAKRDELWATESTIQSVRELFETQAPESLILKGKRAAVPACRVVRRTNVASRFEASLRRGLTPLIGRGDVLDALHRRLRSALEGRLAVISVVGNPGVGKTRVLEEFKKSVTGDVRVVTGRCENATNAKPLKPFIDVLVQLLAVEEQSLKEEVMQALASYLRRLDPELVKHEPTLRHLLDLEPMPGGPTHPEFLQHAYVDALGALFSRLCAKAPLVVIFDDWQWADDTSRQVLGSVMRALRSAPALLLIGSREFTDPLLCDHPRVDLVPFSPEESASVVASLLQGALDLGGLDQVLHDRSGGNPLFLEELCRALPGAIASGDERLVRGEVPTTLRGITQVRVERLPPDSARLLRAAAVIGNEFPLWLLARMTELKELKPLLEQLEQDDLISAIEPERTYRFKHSTTREISYESVRLSERRLLHQAAAAALKGHAEAMGLGVPYEELAYHAVGAGDHLRAARFAELAGDKAAASSSLDRARQQYRVALDALETCGLDESNEVRWLALVSKWAAGSLYSPAQEHLEIIERARGRALRLSDWLAAARAEYWLGWFCYALGEQESAIRYCRSALEKAHSIADERLAGQLLLNLGQSLAATGEYDEALKHLEAGLVSKQRTSQTGNGGPASARRTPLGFAYAMACKGLLHGDRGDFSHAYQCFDEALPMLEKTGYAVEGSCLGILGMVQLLQGRWQESLNTARRAQATAERVNGPYVFAMSKTVSGYARWILERSQEALDELHHAVTWMEGRGIGLFISFNYGYLAEALAAAGQPAAAREYAGRALARTHTDRLGETAAYRTLARLAHIEDSSSCAAAEYLEQAMSSAVARNSPREQALTELEYLKLRRTPRAASAAFAPNELQQAFRAMGMQFYEFEVTKALS